MKELPQAFFHLSPVKEAWPQLSELAIERIRRHGDVDRFFRAESDIRLNAAASAPGDLDRPAPRCTPSNQELEELRRSFELLIPWKKGPFEIPTARGEQLLVDAEWDCDLKWRRVTELATSFEQRTVLDVGSGNGYYLFRLAGAGARAALGIEPSVLYSAQLAALQRLYRVPNICMLTLRAEDFLAGCGAFDTVLSMGVLYHRRSPLDHLKLLHGFTRPGGELVLETIVVKGPLGHSLVPEGRYAKMPNVFFLPSVPTLESWLRKIGFIDIRSGTPVPTTEAEQRTTAWMPQPSLADFLDTKDPTVTVEGHPAPQRVVMVARRRAAS